MPVASMPTERNASSVSAHASGFRLATTTRAPACPNPSAIARPIPRVPPVTSATRPSRRKSRLTSIPSASTPPASHFLLSHRAFGTPFGVHESPGPTCGRTATISSEASRTALGNQPITRNTSFVERRMESNPDSRSARHEDLHIILHRRCHAAAACARRDLPLARTQGMTGIFITRHHDERDRHAGRRRCRRLIGSADERRGHTGWSHARSRMTFVTTSHR